MGEQINCPLCGDRNTFANSARVLGRADHNVVIIQCNNCTHFVINRRDALMHLSDSTNTEWTPLRLSALVREQTIYDRPMFFLQFTDKPHPEVHDVFPVNARELLDARWPTLPETLDRILLNLVAMSKRRPGAMVTVKPSDISLLFAETTEEAGFFVAALRQLKWIEKTAEKTYAITLEGWQRVADLERHLPSPDNPVFVAMWFGDKGTESTAQMKAVYSAISRGVQDAGYKAMRVDLVEHNQYIMNRILGDIRAAPFIVADFTGHRHGVYYEAAFARGLGREVVCCCRADNLSEAHFDTRQLNHILWDVPEQISDRVCSRIRGTIGQGPHTFD